MLNELIQFQSEITVYTNPRETNAADGIAQNICKNSWP
jgi:hypothetical protein